MARQTMTFGVMPTREAFDAACAEPDPENGRSVDNHGFHFGGDPRVGTDTLTPTELWTELGKAHAEYEAGRESSGDWLSGVLGCLGFEWV